MTINSWKKPSAQEEKEVNANDPSIQTFVGFVNTDDEEEDTEEGEGKKQWSFFIPNELMIKRQRRRRKKKLKKKVPAIVTWRSTLLALYLCITLGVFWLLDSMKDPILATCVNGDLQSHQPYAKMTSVLGTLFCILFLEYYFTTKKRPDNIPSEQDILDGGGVWTKMNTSTSYHQRQTDIGDDEEEGISVEIFTWLGVIYILLLGFFGVLLNSGSNTNSPIVGYGMYWAIESYGSLFVASFWSFANTTLSLEAAEHYYGYVIALGQLGAIFGSSIATTLFSTTSQKTTMDDHHPNISRMIVYSCFGIFLSILEIRLYDYYYPKPLVNIHTANQENNNGYENNDDDDDEESYIDSMKLKQTIPLNPSSTYATKAEEQQQLATTMNRHWFGFRGIMTIWRHSYLLYILGASCLYEISLTCLDYQLKMIGLQKTQNNFGRWMGQYGLSTNIISLFLSFFLFPYVIRNYGLKTTIRLFPTLLLFVTLLVYLALPLNLPVLFISMCVLKGMTYSIHDPATELLYQPTSKFIKFKSKFWIDVVGDRIAKAMGSFMNARAGSAENIVLLGTIPSVLTSIALLITSYKVGILFDHYITHNIIIGQNENNLYQHQGDEDESEYAFHSHSEHSALWKGDFSSNDEYDNRQKQQQTQGHIESLELVQQKNTEEDLLL